jgi:predicted PurR-regulated permease PerM
MGNNRKLASVVIVFSCLVVLVVPSILFLDSIVEGVVQLRESYQAGSLTIPPPSEDVKNWPLVGETLYGLWMNASIDIKSFVVDNKEQLLGVGRTIAKGFLGVTSSVLQMVGAFIIAGVMLAYGGTGEAIRLFFRRVAGSRGDEFADVTKATVGNVIKGILGVALIQAFLTGVGLLLADVPFVGLWTILIFVLAILQLPPAIVVIPIVVYLFSVEEPTTAVLWTIYLLVAGLSDNIIKPLLLGKNAPVPMLVIFIGVIGGFMLSGFIGLFSGAIVMSIGYKLFSAWIGDDNAKVVETDMPEGE